MRIIVNGKGHRIEDQPTTISYEELLQLAFGKDVDVRQIYTMVWQYKNNFGGSITREQKITRQDGMIVSIADTSRS